MIQANFSWSLLITLTLASVFVADALNCFKCDSSSNVNCVNDINQLKAEGCNDEKMVFCFTSIDDKTGIVTRGCRGNNTDCSSGNCLTCNTDDCNKHNICQKCDSSTDSSCSKLSSIVLKLNQLCEDADTKCLINIKSDKHTERRCATADDLNKCSTDEKTCKTCSGGNCNVGIFPANRLNCYQCAEGSDGCAKLDHDKQKSEPCLLYDANDKCYMIGSDADHVIRGCVSDASDQNKCKSDKTDSRCYTCNKANCNDNGYKRDQSLRCIQCSSTKENTNCMWGQDANEAKNCKNQIDYDAKEMCFTQLQKDGNVTRGCYYDRDSSLGDCTKDTNCDTCTGTNGCNQKDQVDFTCIRCRSDNDKACYDEPLKATSVAGGKCRNAVSPNTAECFHGIWNGVVIRGCLVDGDVRQQEVCNDKNNKQCIKCNGKNCNNGKTSGAAGLSVMATLTTLLLACLAQFL